MSTVPPAAVAALQDRPLKDTICLFDVDDTLTPARQGVSNEMLQKLKALREKCAIGYVSAFWNVHWGLRSWMRLFSFLLPCISYVSMFFQE